MLILDDGDYSMGTAFGGAIRETGAELQLLSRMGYDATTFGNHEFDFGPDGLGQSIGVAAKAGHVPPIVASNTNFDGKDATLADLQRLAKDGVIRRHLVIERGGVRFGIFGLLGKEAGVYTQGGAASFPDAIETAKDMVNVLHEKEKVDVVICLSHGGVARGKDGKFTGGDDVRVAEAVPGIDVVIGGHSHTALQEAIIVNGRTPVVQAGKYGQNLGELVITVDGGKLTVESYQLHPIDDTIAGDRAIADEIDGYKKTVTEVVFASRGYSIDQPLAVAPRDLPNTFTDIAAGTPLANLVTDSFRKATNADIAITANALMRAGLTRGKSGVQTVYDVFAVAPLGAGIVDTTAGSALVTAYFTGQELKHMLEFLLVDNPTHPGRNFSPHFGHEVSLRYVAPNVRRRNGDRNRRPRSRLPCDRNHREGRAFVQPHMPSVFRQDSCGHPDIHKGQTDSCAQEQGGAAAQGEDRATRRSSRRHARPASPAGYGG